MVTDWYRFQKGLPERIEKLEAEVAEYKSIIQLLIEQVADISPSIKTQEFFQKRSDEEIESELATLNKRKWELENFNPVNRLEIKKRNTDLSGIIQRIDALLSKR